MPELPEVETVRRGLAPFLEGATIERFEARRPDLRFPLPDHIEEICNGRLITGLGRRAKYLLFHLDDDMTLISHLGMSGSWRIESDGLSKPTAATYHPKGKSGPHDHLVLDIACLGKPVGRVIYNDPRRFGFLLQSRTSELDRHPALSGLGMEPLGNALGGTELARLMAGRIAPLKAALLDQRLIAGLGNIYVCEALWLSRLSPRRRAGSIVRKNGGPTERADRLASAIRSVLTEAVEAGGSSLRDHIRADGTLGYFQHRFKVYDREGRDCPREECNGVIKRIVQSGRSTFHCPVCQR
ncbi:bifunctional DNA-formamidopyrimidine glycosylase/DNA-(apurinic or apyrimidinic site) lyase [Notoacmeibacter sp. MSK16QG-6]|uniref:bifunctional DNA-formamidopyrimidine glycosylase/DNA-(apurinic or apyrimidinic site) lyase n=1 Tax=Notoacmeibacter sp. MSK16QG-6 TaxID=2957982 RepID=UPI00209F7D17|nr:bifunctional DNA-formamidopyrimidine glycosylase/DNA-(apurinic or apyrimidinic site) lyase [Notoacmeibacter sp. MSK16QG-6]MCP1198774.1 bifunctional DNA-formamidopyrimidine glycosylase/DNA-(apurinic or apyrimidinic site) lyase [Notoacmeibacter sp. MSK16QG-6]